jgi:hypothetical protein
MLWLETLQLFLIGTRKFLFFVNKSVFLTQWLHQRQFQGCSLRCVRLIRELPFYNHFLHPKYASTKLAHKGPNSIRDESKQTVKPKTPSFHKITFKQKKSKKAIFAE